MSSSFMNPGVAGATNTSLT